MNFNELNAISNAFIAVATVLGVAGALGYYFSHIEGVGVYELVVLTIVYFLMIFLSVYWVRRRIKYEKSD